MLSCITRMPCHAVPGQAYIHADIPLSYMYILHRARDQALNKLLYSEVDEAG